MTQYEIDQQRLQRVLALDLGAGSHKSLDEGLCVMEAVAFVAGDPWSDSPSCACPVISAFLRSWNDGLPTDAARNQLLKPFIAQLVGSKSTATIENQRAWLAIDWTIRVFTPAWLGLVPSLVDHAKILKDQEEIADLAGLLAAQPKLRDAQHASAAAWAAAWAAASAAAWAAASAAAWAAASAAAWAAAWAATWDATWDAASAAAYNKLYPTVEWCQKSAVVLVQHMLEIKEHQ